MVNIPAAGPPAGPTGQVFAGDSGLNLPNGNPGIFYFANLDGSISGWNPDTGTNAVVVVSPTGEAPAVYTGLRSASGFRHVPLRATPDGCRRVFDRAMRRIVGDDAFAAGDNPDGLAPFNVQNINGLIYVTYAHPGPDRMKRRSARFVNVFNPDGSFVMRIDSDQFASPWAWRSRPTIGEFSNAC